MCCEGGQRRHYSLGATSSLQRDLFLDLILAAGCRSSCQLHLDLCRLAKTVPIMPEEERPPRYTSDEERLRFLHEWAESKKYVVPGDCGTLATGVGGINSLVFGGPMRTAETPYNLPLAPPSYTEQQPHAASTPEEKSRNPFKRWLEKRKSKASDEPRDRRASAPA